MKHQKSQSASLNNGTLGIGVVTPFYDTLVDAVGWGTELQKRLVRMSELEPRDNLIDIGSGTGTFCILAKKFRRSAKIAGIDPDAHIIKIAKQKTAQQHLKVEYIESTAQNLPFKSGSLDIAVSSLAFHHMPLKDKKLACREIYRVLKPGGHFLLADFGPSRNWLVRLFFVIGNLLKFENPEYAQDNLAGILPILMEKAGFKVRQAAPMRKGVQFLIGIK